MSGYAGRKAPNVSQYIQDLNTVPTPQELAQPKDTFGLDDDLSLFTNTEFFDFDLGTSLPDVSQSAPLDKFDLHAEERAQRRNASIASSSYGGAPTQQQQQQQPPQQPPQQQKPDMDFNFTGEFQSLDFSFPVGGLSDPNFQHQPSPYPVQHQPGTSTSSPISATSPTAQPGGKRKLDGLNPAAAPPMSIEDVSRFAAEEDKRRRNTAASARFRIKKKQREQQLEKTAKEMTDKVSTLESRVAQLEMENKWLKGLITEKNDGKNTSEFAELYRKFIGNDITKEDRSKGENKDGVGTKSEA